MATAYDETQDAQIRANSEAIREQTRCLRELRDHFLPQEEERRFKRLRKYLLGPVLKLFGIFVFICGLWDFGGWYLDRLEIARMARHYAEVAKRMYYEEGNATVASAFLDKAIEMQGEDPEYRFLRAYIQGLSSTRLLLNLDRPFDKAELDLVHTALAEARFLQELKPSRAEPYLLQAQILLALKEVDRAAGLLERAKSLSPNNDFVHLRMAQLYLDYQKNVGKAELELAEVEKINPKSKWLWLWRGILAKDYRKDFVVARSCYEKALEIDSKFDQALCNLGWTWMSGPSVERDYAKAREYFLRAIKVNPEFKEAYYAMGMAYGYEDNYLVAKTWYSKAIGIDEKFLTAYKWRGIVLSEMSDWDGAVADFDSALSLDPMNADLYVRRGMAFERQNKPDKALADLRFASELEPNNARMFYYQGNLFTHIGEFVKAVDFYNKALAIQVDYDDAFVGKARALAKTGDLTGAIQAVDAAIAVVKYKPERHWLEKGSLLLGFDRKKEALACFSQAIELNPKFAAAYRRDAEVALSLGDTERMRQRVVKYLELVPTDTEVRKWLK